VIVHISRGTTAAAKADAYLAHLKATGISNQLVQPGNRGAMVLQRDRTGFTDWITISMWDAPNTSTASERLDFDVRRHFPGDAEFLLGPQTPVERFELVYRSPDALASPTSRSSMPATDTQP
jgi:hypothetical protein